MLARGRDEQSAVYHTLGTLDGKPVTLYRDTGCGHTLVHESLVPRSQYLEETLAIQSGDGRVTDLSMAEVVIACALVQGRAKVGVVRDLPEEVLLASDLAGPVTCGVARETRGQYRRRMLKEGHKGSDPHSIKGTYITPVLQDLHWLSVRQRVFYKSCV